MYREERLRSLLEGRRLLIAGYGREGRSMERLLLRLLPGGDYAVADGEAQIATEAKKDYDLIVKSPGVPMRVFPQQVWERITSLTDMFMQVYGDLTIGVTGTKGKSTTASLIHHLLPGSRLAGNIGVPLFDIVEELDEDSLVVAELSCHQLEVLRRSPHVGVLLNFYQEHLDHYENYEGYKMAKMQIGLHQRAGDKLYYCADNAELAAYVDRARSALQGEVMPYSIAALDDGEESLLQSCRLAGEHNKSNALVAMRVARAMRGDGIEVLASRLDSFQGLRHRMERVGEKCGLEWYDDSISTIPEATLAAVKALGGVATLILGGFDRGIDYSPLVAFLHTGAVKRVAFVGAAGRRMKAECEGVEMECLVEDDYAKIVAWCAAHTPRGGKVLLSPAAASYDAFRNFEERGDRFRELIEGL